MKQEPIETYLRRRLTEFTGQHVRIARETGVPQSTISRIHQSTCSPRLETVQPLLDWFAKQDKPSARRVPNASRRLKAGRAGRSAATALG